MSGGSPAESDILGFGAGRSTPPPTTSYMAARSEIEGAGDASTLLEQKEPKEKDKDKEETDKDKEKEERGPMGPGENPGYKEDDAIMRDDSDRKDRDGGGDRGGKKMSNGDVFDGAVKLPLGAKVEEEEDETCMVKCLYYTMQCCECTIS